MKPYGLPRSLDREYPDKADIKRFGASATDRCARADRGKNKARRLWKKAERAHAKNDIRKNTED